MQILAIPFPVVRFLRRLFNVVTSLTISNQYLLVQKADRECDVAGTKNGSGNVSRASYLLLSKWMALKSWRNPDAAVTYSSTAHQRDISEKNLESFDNQPNPPPPQSQSNHDFPPPRDRPQDHNMESLSQIQELLLYPILFDPVLAPRYPIVLCHGLYGFDVRGPSSFPVLQMHYWSNVLRVLKKTVGAEVIVTGVPGTGSIQSRALTMDKFLSERARGQNVNFVAHSMGGLDCRHLISHVKPQSYTPLSLTTISTPHRGSPFMDWCTANIGLGNLRDKSAQSESFKLNTPRLSERAKFTLANLPSSFTTLLLSVFDSPAYANLTTSYLNDVFNPSTPNDPNVKYYSVAARTDNINIWHPLWFPKMVVDGYEEKERERLEKAGQRLRSGEEWGNDGLVTVRSAKWGQFLGVLDGCDHWDIRGSRGFGDWATDLSIPLGGQGIDSWSWKDWGRFIRVWKKEQERQDLDDKNAERTRGPSEASSILNSQANKEKLAKERSDESDADVKAATDRLSAVFDWLVEHMPDGTKLKTSSSSPSNSSHALQTERETEMRKAREAIDPRLKFDLERFYVALSRKLYDEGL